MKFKSHCYIFFNKVLSTITFLGSGITGHNKKLHFPSPLARIDSKCLLVLVMRRQNRGPVSRQVWHDPGMIKIAPRSKIVRVGTQRWSKFSLHIANDNAMH